MVLFLCHISTQRPMNDRKIAQSYGRCLTQRLANSIESFISREKKMTRRCLTSIIYRALKPYWVSIARLPAHFSKASLSQRRSQQRLQKTWQRTVFDLARPTRPSCAAALPKELGHWFCSQNLLLSSGIAFRSDCQMTGRGSNLDSNLNSAAWPTGCKGLICSKVPK